MFRITVKGKNGVSIENSSIKEIRIGQNADGTITWVLEPTFRRDPIVHDAPAEEIAGIAIELETSDLRRTA